VFLSNSPELWYLDSLYVLYILQDYLYISTDFCFNKFMEFYSICSCIKKQLPKLRWHICLCAHFGYVIYSVQNLYKLQNRSGTLTLYTSCCKTMLQKGGEVIIRIYLT
jgi:hypothetical protein